MRSETAHVPLWTIAAGALLALPLTSCTTTSNFAALSATNPSQQAQPVAGTAPIELKGEEATAADLQPDAPAIEDPVAQHRPTPLGPPIVLTSVPRTSVQNKPTNQIMMIRTTAYSHLQADSLPYGRKSAAGGDLKYGTKYRSAAADWSKYPLGTTFQIEGLPYTYVIDDYGSALCGTETIDIYKPDLSGIGRWGVRNIPVRVIKWGSYEESAKILRTRTHLKHAHHVRTMLREIERKGRAGYLNKPTGGSA
ncbi:MAG: 3D domain-containing protein [Verrucomicrobiota bacterium]